MKETGRVSTLMLERYRLGEVTREEQKLVEAELAAGIEVRRRCESLENSDKELRLLFPWEKSALAGFQKVPAFPAPERGLARDKDSGRLRSKGFLRGLWAAAVLLCVLFPSLYYLKGRISIGNGISGVQEGGSDRLKGTESKYELSIYLRDRPVPIPADEGRRLPDGTLLRAGNTIQLAYTTPPGDVYYGVIFSIDGRSTVTLHYPYRRQQNPVLTPGKRTFLGEAYTLDDAPDFEIFFMVISQTPLNTESVLNTAEDLAMNLPMDPVEIRETLLAKARAFEGWDVEIITIRK